MLVMSHNPAHTGSKLCKDPMSYDPSIVSFKESLFRDMDTKTTWPLCTGVTEEIGCYDWETHALVESKARKRDMGSYIVEWS